MDNLTLAPNTLLQFRYQIERLLGQGGMGAVYRAWDLRLAGHIVAVKENFETTPQAQSQFQTEAVLLANLQHPMLPRVTDHFVEASGRQYLVMDFVEGDDLQEMVQQRGAVQEAQAITWGTQILNALDYLHTQPRPIIHRDVKPSNIKIRPDGRAMLVDFGIAKAQVAGQKTVAGAQAYSPGYSPLEQYGYGTTDARSDIYALGATLYFVLTNRIPPEARDLATGAQILTPPSQLNAQLTRGAESAILKAMALQPAQRFQTAAEFRDALNPQVGTSRLYTPSTQPQPVIGMSPKPAYAQPQAAGQMVPSAQFLPISSSAIKYSVMPAAANARSLTNVRFASYGRRILAVTADAIFLSFALAMMVGVGNDMDKAIGEESVAPFRNTLILIWFVAFLVYVVVLPGKWGKTPGNKISGTRIVRITTGNSPGYRRATLRAFVLILELVFLRWLVGFAGLVWPLWDKQKQAWHDKAANTIVIRA